MDNTQQARTLTANEKSLLLYLETCCVNNAGAYEPRRMNDDDRQILRKWVEKGFLDSGRIKSST